MEGGAEPQRTSARGPVPGILRARERTDRGGGEKPEGTRAGGPGPGFRGGGGGTERGGGDPGVITRPAARAAAGPPAPHRARPRSEGIGYGMRAACHAGDNSVGDRRRLVHV